MSALPKRLGHIWIGPKPAPTKWMQTWPEKHPDWEYTVYDNDFLTGYPFRLRRLIDEYFRRGLYAGVQDMMRYEILYEFGGFMADADAICLHPVDELLTLPRAYTVYDRPETDKFRGVCPILACEPRNPFLKTVIDRLAAKTPWELRKAEVSTGNRFLMSVIRDIKPGPEHLHVWPTHYFVPWQKSDPDNYYKGPDKVYAEQKWATSMYAYNRKDGPSTEVFSHEDLIARRQTTLDRLTGGAGQPSAPRVITSSQMLETANGAIGDASKLMDDPTWKKEAHALNTALENQTSDDDGRFHGLHFYRHMQNQALTESKLRTRSQQLRECLIGWLASAKKALVIGVDTGHLPLSALLLSKDLTITALDACDWPNDKDKNPPKRDRYVPIAAKWLKERFDARFSVTLGNEVAHFTDPNWWSKQQSAFDLVMIPSVNIRSLHALKLLQPHLEEGTLIVSASPTDRQGCEHAQRLTLQKMAYKALVNEDFGQDRGSYSVCHLRKGL